MIRRYFIIDVLLLLFLFGCGLSLYIVSVLYRSAAPLDAVIVIERGVGRLAISEVVNAAGIEHPSWVLGFEDWRRGDDYLAKSGEYLLPRGTNLAAAMDIIHEGDSIAHRFTIPEGWTVAEVIAALEADDRLTGEISIKADEGDFLPETYHFIRGAERDALIERFQQSKEIAFASLWAERRRDDLPINSLEDAIVLASIVEKETGLAEERGKVASVFVNRLRHGWPLQSDPTVVYGLRRAGLEPEKLLRRHWKHRSPWNTYLHKGLPPSPICNPGLASLEAVLHPAETDYLFFVADGKGGHRFAISLDDHNRNVRALRAEDKD